MAHLNLTGEGRALLPIPGCLLDTHLPFSRTRSCAKKCSYIWRCLGASYSRHASTSLFVATGQLRQGCQPRFHLCIGQRTPGSSYYYTLVEATFWSAPCHTPLSHPPKMPPPVKGT